LVRRLFPATAIEARNFQCRAHQVEVVQAAQIDAT